MGPSVASAHVLLTGATGFLGKVVLEELLHRREALGIARVSVLVRGQKGQGGRVTSPQDRFRKVLRSEVFRRLPPGWEAFVEVVGGDLAQPRCGLSPEALEALTARTTHIIHCAASVEFDLPVAQAAASNITSALNVLELGRACPRLHGLVDVSTAYVTPWRPGALPEALAHLPRPAEELYRAILDGSRPEAELKAETGHPNTYTYTKCLAEHLLCARRGAVPLRIVRPSIISAAWKAPFPGWLDSAAAFAGCLLYAGLGVVKAWVADPSVRLDVVPVDVVSHEVVAAAFEESMPAPGEAVPIQYAVMGIERALRVDLSVESTTRFFRERPGGRARPGMFIGRAEHGFRREDFLRRELPTRALKTWFAATNQRRERGKLEKVDEQVRYMNSVFEYFTHHTFDFRSRRAAAIEGYSPEAYLDVVNRGLYRHLLRMDETQVTLAGKAHDDARSDVEWLQERPHGTWAIRTLGIALRKALRRCTSRITFDRTSFERAVDAAPADTLFILAPSHRSYLDFLLSSYLCFQHPELGIPVPHIAAAEEFSRIPFVGHVLQQAQAFYLKRGVGKESTELNQTLGDIISRRASVMFFVEGQRSRSRHVLAPKRGLLRGLQQTNQVFTVLPLSISYDRVPEEPALERELSGGGRPRMSLRALLTWLGRLAQDEVRLGRIHLSCGAPILMTPASDVRTVSERIVAAQQHGLVATRFHVRAFLRDTPLEGVDEAWLVEALRARGGRVLDSDLPAPDAASPVLRQSLRNQWMHWFYPDALALYPDSLAVRDHVARRGWLDTPTPRPPSDPRVRRLVEALFAPIARDYVRVAEALGSPERMPLPPGPKPLVVAQPEAHLPHLEDAYQALVDQGILTASRPGLYAWGPQAPALEAFRAECPLQGAPLTRAVSA
ncbi:SDR family oxidoreductase [Melittangium boletus]|uniref:SDR family oxidoreductase n=1 Tax=Melittangium boletus TaxID=83453 RepID=UPI003DA518F9